MPGSDPTTRTSRAAHGAPGTGDETPTDSREHNAFLWTVLGVVVLGLWVPPLLSSLSLDETGTAWLIKGSLERTWRESLELGGVAPLYFLLLRLLRPIVGMSEVGLRIPSVVSVAVATLLTMRIGTRLADRRTGLVSGVAFATLAGTAFAAADARPYGMGLLTLTAASLFVVRYLEGARTRDLAGAVLMAASTLYFHYTFIFSLLSFVVFAGLRRRELRALTPLRIASAAIGFAALSIPAAAHLVSVAERRDLLSSPASPTIADLAAGILPASLVIGLVAGVLLARRGRGFAAERPPAAIASFALPWIILPPVMLHLVSRLSGADLFLPRYLLQSAPALGLAAGAALSAVRPLRAQRIVLTAVVVIQALAYLDEPGRAWHHEEQWRTAAESVRGVVAQTGAPVLVQPGFIESATVELLSDPHWVDALLAPVDYYPMGPNVVLVPYEMDGPGRAYMERALRAGAADRPMLVLVSHGRYSSVRSWLTGRLTRYVSSVVSVHGTLWVHRFDRLPP